MAAIYVNQFGVVSEVIDHNILQPEVIEAIARPVKNALEAHEAVACINRALDNVAYTSRKVAETAERLRK